MVKSKAAGQSQNALHELGYKIFLDRYAQKDMTRETLTVGDTVIVVVDSRTGQREVGTITALSLPKVTIELLDGTITERDVEHVDKPIETTPEQMMDRVARGIAEVEAPEKQDEWAQKFRWLLDGWKFIPGGRILTGAGTDQSLTYYNCMPPEQEILTRDGYMPIAEVQVGDLVVTHRNRLRRVLHKFERETDELVYVIKPRKIGYDALRVTGEHKILVIRQEWVNKHRARDGLRLAQEPQWIPASELRQGDYLALAHNGETRPAERLYVSDYVGIEDYEGRPVAADHPVYIVSDGRLTKQTHNRDGVAITGKRTLAINNELVLDAELMYLFGRWLGDGCVTQRTGTDIPSGIKIVFGLDEADEAQEIATIIADRFGIAPTVKLSSTGRWYDLWVNSMPVGEFFKNLLGQYSYAKRIPTELMQQDDTLTLALLRGLFRADGYVSGKVIGIVLANRVLAAQLHQLLLRLGYVFSIKENTHRLARHPAYRLTGNASSCEALFHDFFNAETPARRANVNTYLEYDNLKWVRIDAIDTERYNGIVMDIEVEDDHSFVSAGVVVSNCFVIPSPKDSRTGIIETLRQMTEIMSRGGGVGINISSLRPRHSYVKGVNGRSSGSVSWGALYSFVTGLIEQGGSRRGALMLILNDWHPDVFNFINSKRQAGQITNANISVGLSDKLMDAVKADGDWTLMFPDTSDPDYDELWDGDIDKWIADGRRVIEYRTVKAREVWDAMIESAWASAEPGVWFRERSNKLSNSWYFNPLISTNPCFTGDTRLATTAGLVKAVDLFNDETEFEVAIDGRFGYEQAVALSSRVFRTGRKPVYRLMTHEGYSLRATADHKIMTAKGWVALGDLKPGDRIHIQNRKGAFGREGSERLGRILGWMVGDGTIKQDAAVLMFFGEEKRELAPLFAEYVNDIVEPLTVNANRSYPVGVNVVAQRDEARVQSTRLRSLMADYGLTEDKHQVPEVVFRGTEAMQRGFLQALFTADGSVQYSKGTLNIRLASSHLPLLEQVQTVLSNFGIASRVYTNRREAQFRDMPDGKGGSKPYWTQAQHELVISRQSAAVFADEIGFLTSAKNQRLAEILAGYVRGLRKDSYTARVRGVLPDGEEDVYDVTVPLSHSLIANGIAISNCGEQSLGAFSVCNLGAINLARFYDAEKHDVLWDDLRDATSYAIRFLDDVIDSTPYFFEENARVQGSERRVGLGTMGIAELMIKLGIRYGSDESVAFIDRLYGFITQESYRTSAEIAAEKGAFPAFDAEKFLQGGFIQTLPDETRELIRKNGIRNVTLLTQAPTGCVAPDTLVSTASGMQPIISMGDPNGSQWQIMPGEVYTDEGLRRTSHFYVNGVQPVKKLTTERGFSISATHNHRLRVIDAQGDYVWRRMDEMRVGDTVVLKRGALGEGQTVAMTPVEQGNRSASQLPATLGVELAELLGLYMGDGYTKKRGGLHIIVNKRDDDLLEHVCDRLRAVWGAERHVGIEERTGCWTVSLTGYYIQRWFAANGMLKPAGNHGEGAAGAFVPDKVLQGGKPTVIAFLRGLFEADGCITRGTITLSSTSHRLVQQVQTALLGLGIVANLRQMPEQDNRYGDRPLYELRLLNRQEAQRFVEVVGFISERKRALCAELGALSNRGDSVGIAPLLTEFYAQSQGIGNAPRQRIAGLIGNGALTQSFVREMTDQHPQLADSRLAHLVGMDVYLDTVASLTDGISPTYDISVPDNHTYIANGFVSHNTTGTMANTSTGIEPFFSWVYYRKSRLGLHEEQVPLVRDWHEQNPGATELPDYFVTAMDLTPDEHVKVQAAFQRWIDSSISKTCNVPNEYTVQQVSDLYMYMYDLGCKGGTIYRDGSRDEQVLMLKGDERAEKEMEEAKGKTPAEAPATARPDAPTSPHRVYPRPRLLNGVTMNCLTPFGTAYVTMNMDEHGNPFEVFITAPGKAGSDLQADAEGLGRMISLSLRTTEPHNRREMLKLVIEQLRDIGGSRSVGFGQNRVISLPDSVARALEETFIFGEQPQQLGLPIDSVDTRADTPPAPAPNVTLDDAPVASTVKTNGNHEIRYTNADLCPSCATISLIRMEGCRKCMTCGYSEC